MIERVMDRRKGTFEIGEIHHPAQRRVGLAAQMQFNPERMPVQSRAFVAC